MFSKIIDLSFFFKKYNQTNPKILLSNEDFGWDDEKVRERKLLE